MSPLISNVSKNPKLHGLDHLRALAITYVLLFHYQLFEHPDWVNRIGNFGWTGVDLFFILSGFLIAGQLFDAVKKGKSISLREFFTKRFFRIIPPYMVILILYAFFPLLREREHLAALWKYLTFTLNFRLDLKTTGTFTHAWSLCVEEQFYLILPITFLLLIYFKAGKKVIYILPVLFILGFIFRYASWHYLVQPDSSSEHFGAVWTEFIYYPTYNRLDGLLVGISIAGTYTFYPRVKETISRHSNILMLVGLIILIAAWFVCTPEDTFITALWGFPLISLGYGIIVAAIVCPSNFFYQFKSVVTTQLATLSYGLYLSHKLLIHLSQYLLQKAGIEKNSNLMMVCCFSIAIAGAIVLRHTIEKPSLKIRDKILQRWKQDKLLESAEVSAV